MRAGRKKWRATNGLPEFDEPFLEYTPTTQLTGTSTEMKMTEATVTKVVGAVYCAFATMLSEEGLAVMTPQYVQRAAPSNCYGNSWTQ